MPADRQDWTTEDIEQAKEIFSGEELRGRPGCKLVEQLWGHWRAAGLGKSFFGEPEHDMALALHARAYGLADAGDWERLGDMLDEHRTWYDPLQRPPLSLGPRANLAPELGAALDSHIMDAWVVRDGTGPVKILIVGTGVPQISGEVSADAFMLSLRSGTLDTDLIGTGIIRVELGSEEHAGFPLPVTPVGHGSRYQPEAASAQEAMSDFVAGLVDLGDRTGLIRVHEVDDADQRNMLWRLRELAERDEDAPGVWAPAVGETVPPRVAALLPHLRLPGGDVLSLRLNRELLDGLAYRHLADVYLDGMLGRIIVDIEARHRYHTSEISRLKREHKDYKDASEADRLALWGATVYVNYRYDFEADVAIRLPFPMPRNADKFYLVEVPEQIEEHEKSAKRMAGILEAVRAATDAQRADQPTDRLTAGRFFDAAARGREFAATATEDVAYAAWKDQVSPMLWFEWRRLLTSHGIEASDVFTPHTVMQTFLSYDEIVMMPCTLIDQHHSVVLLDRRRGVTVALDATDRAQPVSSTGSADPAVADKNWNDLAAATGLGEAEFDEALLSLLRSTPGDTVRRILQELTANPSGREDDPAPASQEDQVAALQSALDAARSRTSLSRLLNQALEADAINARHTARLLLAEVSQIPGLSGRDEARIALAEAVVEYQAGRQPEKPYESFKDPTAAPLHEPFHGRFRKALLRAREADPDYTDQWIALLQRAEFRRVVSHLLDGLKEPREILKGDDMAFAALASRTGVEAAALAREIIKSARRLSPAGEAPAIPFVKLGLALEDIFLAEFAGGPALGSIDLLEILTQIGVQSGASGQGD